MHTKGGIAWALEIMEREFVKKLNDQEWERLLNMFEFEDDGFPGKIVEIPADQQLLGCTNAEWERITNPFAYFDAQPPLKRKRLRP